MQKMLVFTVLSVCCKHKNKPACEPISQLNSLFKLLLQSHFFLRLLFLMREACVIQTALLEVDALIYFQDLSNLTSMCLYIIMYFVT